ncbi:MAG: glycoside hydrolase family 127 protein [Bacteroidaceae bacterium]|nr:glycoside hydrolase family 127 protein [Bacteroidaceae bacterium]
MKSLLTSIAALTCCLLPAGSQTPKGYPITPVPFTSVKVVPGTFWGQRLEASRKVTVPLAFSKCEETGRYTNFSNAAEHLQNPSRVFDIKEGTFPFDDTDPYKTIEGASYILQTYPDKALEAYIDSVLDVIASAQEPDGYLFTGRTQNPEHPHGWAGPKRWSAEEQGSHELYNLGHMVEAAIAHFQATGSRKFLDIAIRYADLVCKEVGPNPGQACVVPGHQIAEMALAKLYLATGDRKYLDEAKFFLDYRGKTTIKHEYSQAHKPVVEQDEAVGHAVRAAYMYAGMADVAALTGDQAYVKAVDAIWDNIVSKKLYITGGIGATANGEAFAGNYELPNMSAYCETCAAIGNVYVNHRLFLLHGASKYYDVLERTLYNGLLSGVSLEGNGFFYPNPLESAGGYERKPWFGCACCPSNICRFIPSLPGYVYAVKDRSLYVNLFLSNSAELKVGGKDVRLSQTTNYPWGRADNPFCSDITLRIDKNRAGRFAMKIRIPGWAKDRPVPSDLYQYVDGKQSGYSVVIKNKGKQIMTILSSDNPIGEDGYLTIDRKWKTGDEVDVNFWMEPRVVRANDKVEADRGMLCVECGPLVYCAEHSAGNMNVEEACVSPHTKFSFGRTEIAGTPVATLIAEDQPLTLIPYYAWCHRGAGRMRVWLPEAEGRTPGGAQSLTK